VHNETTLPTVNPAQVALANYQRQPERHNISLWFALAIVIVPVVGLGVFLAVASGLGAGAPPAAIAHFALPHQ
jgi:hypothetical protein